MVLRRVICNVTAIPAIIKIRGMYQALENKIADTINVTHKKTILLNFTSKGTPLFVL